MEVVTGESKTKLPCENAAVEADRLYCLSYVSTQVQRMSNQELLGLLDQARDANAKLGVTGLLLHRGDSFFQVLEGEYEEVQKLYEHIARDPRHQRVELVTEGYVTNREYTDWQMAFVELDGQNFSAMPGFSDLLKQTPEAREFLSSLSRSKKLALLFSVMD